MVVGNLSLSDTIDHTTLSIIGDSLYDTALIINH